MKPVKIFLLIVFLASFLTGKADEHPWKKYGFDIKVVTLSNGKYQEFHDLEDVVEIGSVLYNTQTKKIVGFVEHDTLYNEAYLKPHIISRWISPDPLSEEYSSWSPYNYTMNNPILFIDPDGRYVDWYLNLEKGNVEYRAGSESHFDEGLVHLAADDASVGDIEDALSDKGYGFEKDASVSGGFNVDTESAYKGWAMMQIFSPENVGTVLLLAASDFGASSKGAKKFGEKIVTSSTKTGSKFTKSSLKLGQQMHKGYKANIHNPAKGLYKEFTGVKGIRPDFVDMNKRIIYELKPNNPRQISAGWKQLNNYKTLFEKQYGGTWKTVLDLY